MVAVSETLLNTVTHHSTLRKVLLGCGVVGAAGWVVMDVVGSLRYPGYSYVDQTISELSAEGAPTRLFMTLFSGIPYAVLMAAFGVGIWITADGRRVQRITGALVIAETVWGFAGGLAFPMAIRGHEETLRNQMHAWYGIGMPILFLLVIGFGSRLFGRRFRYFSYATVVVMLLGGALTGLQAVQVPANKPTPWLGVEERINAYASMLWLAALAVGLLRAQTATATGTTAHAVRAFIRRHPALTFYVVAFVISQGGVLLVAAPGGIPGPADNAGLFPIALMAWLAGITVSGLLLTGLVSGKAGFRDLLARLLRWRVSIRWYAVALMAAPLAYAAVTLVLTRFSSEFLPKIVTAEDKTSLVLTAVAVGLLGGFLEEIGWTGFAIPELRRRYGVLSTGLIAGLLWGGWHILITYWRTDDPGYFWPSSLAPFLLVYLLGGVGGLTAYRVLMVWVYDRSESLLLAVLMHASLIVCNIYLLSADVTGKFAVISSLASTAALWGIVATLAVTSRRPERRREQPTVMPRRTQRVPQ